MAQREPSSRPHLVEHQDSSAHGSRDEALLAAKKSLVVALDVSTIDEALHLADELRDDVGMVKVGLELLMSAGLDCVSQLRERGLSVFLDGKFHDIPNTVAQAAKAVTRLGIDMFNVHALGGEEMMAAAASASRDEAAAIGIRPPHVVAVTILTSIDRGAMNTQLHIPGEVADEVESLAASAIRAGLDGVVASPLEIAMLRKRVSGDMLIVTPGIRPSWASLDDQRRVSLPREALAAGATYLVVGRPITRPPASLGSPAEAARLLVEEIVGTGGEKWT